MKPSRKKAADTARANAERRRQAVRKDFDNLHNVKRLRFDDCINKLAAQYCLTTATITRYISTKDKPADA